MTVLLRARLGGQVLKQIVLFAINAPVVKFVIIVVLSHSLLKFRWDAPLCGVGLQITGDPTCLACDNILCRARQGGPPHFAPPSPYHKDACFAFLEVSSAN